MQKSSIGSKAIIWSKRQVVSHIHTQVVRETDTQIHIHTHRGTHRQTDWGLDTDRHRHTHTYIQTDR